LFRVVPLVSFSAWVSSLVVRIHMGVEVKADDHAFVPLLTRPHMPVDFRLRYSTNRLGTSVTMWPWACYFLEEDIHTYWLSAVAPRIGNEYWRPIELYESKYVRMCRGPPLLWYPAYVALRDEVIVLDAPLITTPLSLNPWTHDHKRRSDNVKALYVDDGAELVAMYNSMYGRGHYDGFVKDLLALTYKLLLYSRPGTTGWEYVELSDEPVTVVLHNLNWFRDDRDRSPTAIERINVDALFVKSTVGDCIRASSWPYTVYETVDREGYHIFKPNETLFVCVNHVLKAIYDASNDKRDLVCDELAGKYVKRMLAYEFIVARLVPAMLAASVDKHVKANAVFWESATDAVCCLFALGEGVRPYYYDRIRFTRYVACFTGTFWAMEVHAWSRSQWYHFVRDSGDMLAVYYKHIQPDSVVESVLGKKRIGLYATNHTDMSLAIGKVLPMRYVEFVRLFVTERFGNAPAMFHSRNLNEFVKLIETHKWFAAKCTQTYLQCFYYPSRNHSLRFTLFHNKPSNPTWLTSASYEMHVDDTVEWNMTPEHIVWTAIQNMRSLVESDIDFREGFLGTFAKDYFKDDERDVLCNAYTPLCISDDEYMDVFLKHKHYMKLEVIGSGKKRHRREIVQGMRLDDSLISGLTAAAVSMARGAVCDFAKVVEKHLPFLSAPIRFDAAHGRWYKDDAPLAFRFHLEPERAVREATVHDVVCEMFIGVSEAYRAFAEEVFSARI
ncbi:unnamed protein product, partial [Ixodes hexagonus]